MKLVFHELSEELNEQGQIECWCEFGNLSNNWEMEQLLEEHQVKIHYIDPDTMKVHE